MSIHASLTAFVDIPQLFCRAIDIQYPPAIVRAKRTERRRMGQYYFRGIAGPSEVIGMEFMPELQREWSFVGMAVSGPREVTVRVVESERLPSSETLGRHVSDIRSWPEVWREGTSVEFRFADAWVLQLTEENSREEIDSPVFDGSTFRRYTDSLLLRRQREFQPGIESPFLHYELVFQDQQVDVVCIQAPAIVIR